MEINLVNTKADWESYVLARPEANFLQSWNWGEFHRQLGKEVWPLGLFAGDQQLGAALTVKEEAKRGNYLTVAGGPLLDWSANNALTQLQTVFAYLQELAQAEDCSFVRFRPQVVDSAEVRKLVAQLDLQEAPMHLTADLTLQLDLNQSEQELLSQMRKNTRYEIRKASKKNIQVRQSQDPTEIKEFYEHQLKLAAKHNFVPFSYDFLHEQFKVFAADNQATLFHSYQGEQLLASAFIIFYNGEAVYHYGISTPANQKLPGSYACQWAVIQAAQQRGCHHYNLWGIAPKDDQEHRFAGVSLFKRGFGGQEVHYLPAHDLAVSGLYQATKVFELVRSKLRHL
ncbi:MAG: peptidoglycan bridge formation glycyltransferase FemA/FemB family protein [Candidatus Pacebacteria bacterium]|nr:peptidoglycan bridge formation glycyltransferase FemA/FemB family protein [Candidatus Paceibacterota bacterium]